MRSAMLGMLLLLSLNAAGQATPEDAFARFHRGLQAGDFAEMNRHGTPGGAAELAKLPPAEQKQMLELMKKLTPSSYTITGKEAGPDGSVLLKVTGPGNNLMTGKPEPQYGTVRMVKMGADWKMDNMHWSDRPDAKPRQRAASAAEPGSPKVRIRVKAEPPPQAATVQGAPVERKLGEAKAPCVYKPVMTQQDLDNCR